MIAYEELERALARWKARHAGAAVDAADAGVPATAAAVNGHNPERTSEIDIGDDAVESYGDGEA